jgi:predicted transcriptional regulator of viral defense system
MLPSSITWEAQVGTLPRAVLQQAAEQHGVLTTADLLRHGVSYDRISRRVTSGTLIPMFGSTYLIGGASKSRAAQFCAAANAVAGAVLAVESAAELHGFPGVWDAPPTVIAPVGSFDRRPGLRILRRHDLFADHTTRVDGIPVTTVSRTVLDLAARLHWYDLAQLVDQLVAGRRLSIERLQRDFLQLARKGRNGTVAMRTVLEPRVADLNMESSKLEERFVEFLQRHGFPEPAREFRPPWAGASVQRVDFAYVRERVIELDGRRWHDGSTAFETDRRRDRLALSHGWVTLRVTWRQLSTEEVHIAATLRRMLADRHPSAAFSA